MNNEIDIRKIVGKRIKNLRTEMNLTQEELANKTTLVKGKSSIANYESGSNLPSDEVKLELCKIFDCSLDYLLGKSDVRTQIDINEVKFANAGGLDVNDLDPDEIEEIRKQVEYMRWKKSQDKKEKK